MKFIGCPFLFYDNINDRFLSIFILKRVMAVVGGELENLIELIFLYHLHIKFTGCTGPYFTGASYSHIVWGMNKRPVRGRSPDIVSSYQHEQQQ
jgi:hypothetical protein